MKNIIIIASIFISYTSTHAQNPVLTNNGKYSLVAGKSGNEYDTIVVVKQKTDSIYLCANNFKLGSYYYYLRASEITIYSSEFKEIQNLDSSECKIKGSLGTIRYNIDMGFSYGQSGYFEEYGQQYYYTESYIITHYSDSGKGYYSLVDGVFLPAEYKYFTRLLSKEGRFNYFEVHHDNESKIIHSSGKEIPDSKSVFKKEKYNRYLFEYPYLGINLSKTVTPLYNIYDAQGKLFVEGVNDFSFIKRSNEESSYILISKNDQKAIIDTAGNYIIDWSDKIDVKNGRHNRILVEKNKKYAFYKLSGEKWHDDFFDGAFSFCYPNICAIQQKEAWYFIDTTFKPIHGPFLNIERFNDDYPSA